MFAYGFNLFICGIVGFGKFIVVDFKLMIEPLGPMLRHLC